MTEPVSLRLYALATGLAELDEELAKVGRSREEIRVTVCPYFNQLTPEWVERYAEGGADAVAALFFAFTPEDVARAFDDLEVCREAAARAGRCPPGWPERRSRGRPGAGGPQRRLLR